MSNLLHSILPTPNRPIKCVPADLTVAECVKMMVDNDIGALVIGDKKHFLGIVSERDIVRALVYQGRSAELTKVSDIVYKNVTVLSPNDTVDSAMNAITQNKRRHVLISENEELIAIVSIGDVLFNLIEEKARDIEQLKNYISS